MKQQSPLYRLVQGTFLSLYRNNFPFSTSKKAEKTSCFFRTFVVFYIRTQVP
ncbi:hypothetical protein BACCAP_00452 [Pseudoflavonifractor capillosus ATCC 29799]|uniref:Uncharacterized protein n=1 Tax=Pseudoflavonifractor capillosus ATCC 29799 TaxID=411467 RepID=A6NQI2_9FIRM|nr:hypothetical protein BACCAP_00452 [Pseudoflavonifractor capillosus ATCC 29799]